MINLQVPCYGRSFGGLMLLVIGLQAAVAQEMEFHPPALVIDPATPAVMRDLAGRILPVYSEDDPQRYLANLSALQMVAGNYTAAYATRQALRDRRRKADSGRPVVRSLVFDLYAHAKSIEAETRVSFAQAFSQSYAEVVPRLNNQDSYTVTAWLETPLSVFQDALQRAFDQRRTKGNVEMTDAIELMRTYISYEAYRTFGPMVDLLDAENDRRRYVTENEVFIKTPGGTSISAMIVRPKVPAGTLPTLLEFTIYEPQNYARECAAHGYVGVVAYARGKLNKTPKKVVPYQHDGDDARAVIAWIAHQPWSDGRVGMYGGNYSGFTQWAAANRLPPALKAIATSATSAPGIDVPMQGGVVQNSSYRWSSYVTNTKPEDEKNYYDDAQWRELDEKWYRSGKPYRDLGRIYGKPNPIFVRWLNHPSYDRFWQTMVPYRKQFARINIPVLATTGYFAGSQAGSLYFFNQHYRYNPRADQTLVIGPYDDNVMQRGPLSVLQGYPVDQVALVDLHELRYQWFDFVLKGGTKPALLKDRVNYQVMGANEWRHGASLEVMSAEPMKFYLDAAAAGSAHRLSTRKSSAANFIAQTVNLADRSDAGWTASTDILGKAPAGHNDLMFVSETFNTATEFHGVFSGRLDFTVNKMDMDLNLALYELLPGGDYIRLFAPSYEFRASYALDRVHRHLLKAGERQSLTFRSERITSRRFQAGSRLVVVLGINKRPDREINYGTGNDVSVESIADGKIPMKIRWYSDSYIEISRRQP